MAAELRYSCDVCGVQKGAANHWYTLQLGVDLMQVRTWRTGHVEPAALHICGERCLLTKISERLGRESFAADAPAKACTSNTCVHCEHVFQADLCRKCTACHEPICSQCANYRCTLLDVQQAKKLNRESLTLRERLDEIDSQDVDREVGAR